MFWFLRDKKLLDTQFQRKPGYLSVLGIQTQNNNPEYDLAATDNPHTYLYTAPVLPGQWDGQRRGKRPFPGDGFQWEIVLSKRHCQRVLLSDKGRKISFISASSYEKSTPPVEIILLSDDTLSPSFSLPFSVSSLFLPPSFPSFLSLSIYLIII